MRHGPALPLVIGASTSPSGVRTVGAAASAADSTGTGGSESSSPDAAPAEQVAAQAAPAAPSTFQSAAAALAGITSVGGQTQTTATESLLGSRPASSADAADRLMNQVVQTVRSFQTSAGPSLEARVNDPSLGDVRMIVTGRAGEVVQAQLIVHDPAAADALTQAAARAHATSDALRGVNVTVRSESGGSATGGRTGNSFDSSAWNSPAGYGSGASTGGSGQGHAHGTPTGGISANADGSGGARTSHDGSQAAPRQAAAPQPSPILSGRSLRSPLPGGSGSDRRSLLDIRA
jgi:hypothetical protein